MPNPAIKPIIAITLLTISGCLSAPIPLPMTPFARKVERPVTPIEKKTCQADALDQAEGEKISESSLNLEATADKLAMAGKHNEAIRKYNEAAASIMNEAIADGSLEGIRASAFWHSLSEAGVEGFREENQALFQKLTESSFKIGASYTQVGKFEIAIDCFDQALKIGMLPPNDAIVYLNRGDTYKRMGIKDKARDDLKQAAALFKKYKLPSYQKDAEKRLQELSK